MAYRTGLETEKAREGDKAEVYTNFENDGERAINKVFSISSDLVMNTLVINSDYK